MEHRDDVGVAAHSLGRIARLIDYVDQEGDDSEHELYVKLQELKLRNGHYLQELSTRYQAYCAQHSKASNELQVDDFFEPKVTGGQAPVRQGFHGKLLAESSNREHRSRPKTATTNHNFSFTVPQPFQMMQREAERKANTRSLPFAEPAELPSEEDPECLKQFRAQPVPAHVFLPLYRELVEEHETRRESGIQKRKQFLLSSQKPFSFITKEEERKKEMVQRPVTAPSTKEQRRKVTIPKSVLDPTISDKLKEAELLRKINSQLRAKDLLETSVAPIALTRSMRDPSSSVSLKTQQEHLNFLEQNLTFHPRTNPAVPDFQRLYKSFQKESMKRQNIKQTVRSKPFTLRTNLRKRRKPSQLEMGKDLHSEPVTRSRSSTDFGLASLSPNTLPVYVTDSTKKREYAIRSSLEDKLLQEIQNAEWAKKNQQKTKKIQKSIHRRAKALDPHQPLADTCRVKLRQNWQSDLKRTKEYKEELEEMKRRVRDRPYLFEQAKKRHALKEAERRFTRTLQGAGVTEEFVQRKGRATEEMSEEESSQNDEEEEEEK